MQNPTVREIPWNYTSAEDELIVLTLLGREVWTDLEALRVRRRTGRSARYMFRVIGDVFALKRNAFLFHEFISSRRQRTLFLRRCQNDLAAAEGRADGDPQTLQVLSACQKLLKTLADEASEQRKFRRRHAPRFARIVGSDNCSFDPADLVTHATDATDWRHHLPLFVIKPGSASEISKSVRLAKKLGLHIIPRGGGTGLTGGAVPLSPKVIVLNTERLKRISAITEETITQADGSSQKAQFLKAEAGVNTEDAMRSARAMGLVFATDPTSSWACTIAGNIAENAGGKSAVAWGTAIDNVIWFRMIMANGSLWTIKRKHHPLRKILPDDQVIFEIFDSKNSIINTVSLRGDEIRKRGLWKDVSNKALGGVPGLQKEGTDGIIVDACFLLHHEFPHRATACIEFFGEDMVEAGCCIRDLREHFQLGSTVSLAAMEHFDNEYCKAIDYKTKSSRNQIPKAVLLVDLGAKHQHEIFAAIETLAALTKKFPASETHIARSAIEAETFWADRKRLGAIAKRTNAFKLNEDVVLPVDKIADFVRFCDEWNKKERLELADAPNRQLIIATHMHAGDGNIHVNIPVFSNDREMLGRAHSLADKVMAEAKHLNGAVSGEHGIGITKVKYLEDSMVKELSLYRQQVDPSGIFNPRKLADKNIMHEVFTPSFNLLSLEARILQRSGLEALSAMVSGCVRCGKCKPVCCVHSPGQGLFYSPRNKILAIGALIEALLYDTQRRHSLRSNLLLGLKNISEHCTLCHKCAGVCPVKIDKGAITLLEREILVRAGLKKPPLLTGLTLGYLGSQSPIYNSAFRNLALNAGIRAMQSTNKLLAPFLATPLVAKTYGAQVLKSPPKAPPLRELSSSLPHRSKNFATVLHPTLEEPKSTVFYFPGCGSERLFSNIAEATIYLLLKAGMRVVLPPPYLCCGFPHRANAIRESAERISLRNSIVMTHLREMLGHWRIEACVVTCGTCREGLKDGEVEHALGVPIKDASAFLFEKGFSAQKENTPTENILYHAPCHDSLDGRGENLIEQMLNAKASGTKLCCSEAGTLPYSRPDIANRLRAGKSEELLKLISNRPGDSAQILTNCPSCLQGLSRQSQPSLKVEHLAVALAVAAGGPNWRAQFKDWATKTERVSF